MADIKVDEADYLLFLSRVKKFIDNPSCGGMLAETLLFYVESETELRSLFTERKLYFDSYNAKKSLTDPEAKKFCGICYHKYKAADSRIKEIREGRNRWRNVIGT